MHSFLAPSGYEARLVSKQGHASTTLRTNNHAGAKRTANTPLSHQEKS
jgi:hypothetical protein